MSHEAPAGVSSESLGAEVLRLRAMLDNLRRPGQFAPDPLPAYHENPTLDRLTPTETNHIGALGRVAHMYLEALDNDPENEMLTLPEAIAVTAVRDAAEWSDALLADRGRRETVAFEKRVADERTARADPEGRAQ